MGIVSGVGARSKLVSVGTRHEIIQLMVGPPVVRAAEKNHYPGHVGQKFLF